MIHQALNNSKREAVVDLFASVFTSAEGEKEGRLIGSLSYGLASRIDNTEILCFGSYENESLIACIFFTRLRFNVPVQVYMLAPVAVSTESQGRGVGQSLIAYGLNEMKRRCANVAVTYGDPAFYAKSGFVPLSEDVIRAPLALSMPAGWLGQSLTDEPIAAIHERPVCVKEFDYPVYW